MLIMIQDQPEILCKQKAFKRVINSCAFNSIATDRTKWNEFDISDSIDGTEKILKSPQ